MMELNAMELKDSFCELLKSVNRPHTEDTISELLYTQFLYKGSLGT